MNSVHFDRNFRKLNFFHDRSNLNEFCKNQNMFYENFGPKKRQISFRPGFFLGQDHLIATGAEIADLSLSFLLRVDGFQ